MGAAIRAARHSSQRFHTLIKGRTRRDLARDHSELKPSTKRRAVTLKATGSKVGRRSAPTTFDEFERAFSLCTCGGSRRPNAGPAFAKVANPDGPNWAEKTIVTDGPPSKEID